MSIFWKKAFYFSLWVSRPRSYFYFSEASAYMGIQVFSETPSYEDFKLVPVIKQRAVQPLFTAAIAKMLGRCKGQV